MRQVPGSKKSPIFSIVAPFFLVIVLDAMSVGLLGPILAKMVTSSQSIFSHYHGQSVYLIYGIAVAAGPLSFMLGAPVFGYLSDHFGRRRILLACLAGSTGGLLCYLVSFKVASLVWFLVGRFISGFSSGSQGVAQAAMADVSSGKGKVFGIGWVALAMTVGLVLGPLLGGVLTDNHLVSWFTTSTPFYVALSLSALNLVLLLTFVKETYQQADSRQIGLSDYLKQFMALWTNYGIATWFFVFFLFECGWSLYFQSLALLLIKHFHQATSVVGIFASYIGLWLGFGLVIAIRFWVRFFKLPMIITLNFFLMALALGGLYFMNSYISQWWLGVVVALSVAAIYPSLITLLSDKVDQAHQGLLMGMSDMLLSAAFGITALLMGYIGYFNIRATQIVAGLLIIVASLVFQRHFTNQTTKG